MEIAREIYWNVGQGAVILVYLFGIAAAFICVWGFSRRIHVYRRSGPIHRSDRLAFRVGRMFREIFAQRKVIGGHYAGALHALFFWSFGILLLGSLLIMAQADFTDPLFHIRFLQGQFYRWYSLLLDIAGVAALTALAGLLVRRFMTKPAGLETRRDDYIVHFLLLTILVTGFCVEGARIAATEIGTNPGLARFSPIGLTVARLFVELSTPRLNAFHRFFWWLHLFLAMGFIALIPFCKLRHLFTIPANYLFSFLGPKGSIATIDLEDETITQFGAAAVTDLTWKDILDADACIACGRCQTRCPAWKAEKPLSPMEVVQKIGDAAFSGTGAKLADVVGEDAIWDCTTCNACEEVCPAEVGHLNKIIEIRRNLVLMEGRLPGEEVHTSFEHLEVNANPFGLAYAARGAWVEGLDGRPMTVDSDADILYFAGCYASFDIRNRRVARDFVLICDAAGIKVAILGSGERCCGEPARKLGNEYLYQMLARHNIEAIRSSGAKKIVTTCPHCFNTLDRDYRELGLDIPVEHHTTFIYGLLREGRLVLEPEPFAFTYHDSCYLARYRNILDEPRLILLAAGGRLSEMAESGRSSLCCGGGGGRILAEETHGSRINEVRVRMARETGMPLLVSNCPFCLTMCDDGVKSAGLEGELAVKDLAEFVAERIKKDVKSEG